MNAKAKSAARSRCRRRVRWALAAVAAAMVAATPGIAPAADAPATPDALAEALRLEAQHAYRVEVAEGEKQDPVVFTDISPYTTDEEPVKLPVDQSLD